MAIPSSDRTSVLLLQFTVMPGPGWQSRPGWLKVPRNCHPSATGPGFAGFRVVMPEQSVILAVVLVPSTTLQSSGSPRTFPSLLRFFDPVLVTRLVTSKTSVALTPAQYRRFPSEVMSWHVASEPGTSCPVELLRCWL